jgi:hypothetical protein
LQYGAACHPWWNQEFETLLACYGANRKSSESLGGFDQIFVSVIHILQLRWLNRNRYVDRLIGILTGSISKGDAYRKFSISIARKFSLSIDKSAGLAGTGVDTFRVCLHDPIRASKAADSLEFVQVAALPAGCHQQT